MEIMALRQDAGVIPLAKASLIRMTIIFKSGVGSDPESSTNRRTKSPFTPSIPAAFSLSFPAIIFRTSCQQVGFMRSFHACEAIPFAFLLYICFHHSGSDQGFSRGGCLACRFKFGAGSGAILSFSTFEGRASL